MIPFLLMPLCNPCVPVILLIPVPWGSGPVSKKNETSATNNQQVSPVVACRLEFDPVIHEPSAKILFKSFSWKAARNTRYRRVLTPELERTNQKNSPPFNYRWATAPFTHAIVGWEISLQPHLLLCLECFDLHSHFPSSKKKLRFKMKYDL